MTLPLTSCSVTEITPSAGTVLLRDRLAAPVVERGLDLAGGVDFAAEAAGALEAARLVPAADLPALDVAFLAEARGLELEVGARLAGGMGTRDRGLGCRERIRDDAAARALNGFVLMRCGSC